ncbi:hypothetical protein EIP91_011285 [Steccherinum ochraceum]|uniref:Uncharacterized protein n=1 Tax=Steccherinum ochraceum TaxID=92696 RepID=A0A4R0R1Y4_9APHY|nr:hypothetical protein EIP91_011285 [Steccherinum ochraceum]
MRSTDYSVFVRSITFMCYVPPQTRAAYRRAVVDILERCTQAVALSFGPTYPLPLTEKEALLGVPYDIVLVQALEHVYPRLVSFAVHDNFITPEGNLLHGPYFPSELLQPLSNLVSLEFPLSQGRGHSYDWGLDAPLLSLSQLEEITFRHVDLVDLPVQDDLWPWHFPRLRRINVIDSARAIWDPDMSSGDLEELTPFLDAHTETVRELSFNAYCQVSNSWFNSESGYSAIERSDLTYIAFPHQWSTGRAYLFEVLDALPADAARPYVDIWGTNGEDITSLLFQNPTTGAVTDHDAAAEGGVHGLRLRTNVRILDPALDDYPKVTRLLPPGRMQPGDPPIFHNFFGLQIVETSFTISVIGSTFNEAWAAAAGLPQSDGLQEGAQKSSVFQLRPWFSGLITFGDESHLKYAVLRDEMLETSSSDRDGSSGDDATGPLRDDAESSSSGSEAASRKASSSQEEEEEEEDPSYVPSEDEDDSSCSDESSSDLDDSVAADDAADEEEEDEEEEELDDMYEQRALQVFRDVARRSKHWMDYAF